MQGSVVPQPCKCNVPEFSWKLANASVSLTALSAMATDGAYWDLMRFSGTLF